MSAVSKRAALTQDGDNNLGMLTALPQSLLELILIKHTDTKDKLRLRLTCKSFKQVLHDSLVCWKLSLTHPIIRRHHVVRLMKQAQHKFALKTIVVAAFYNLYSLFKHISYHITTLVIRDETIRPMELTGLPRLTALCVSFNDVSDFKYITGLTRLQCISPVGSVEYLAPTLRHLTTFSYNYVQDMDQLTNLEVLEVWQHLPGNFFQTQQQLPLKHLCTTLACSAVFSTTGATPPTTLQHVYIRLPGGKHSAARLPALPETVTHLQLSHAQPVDVQQVTDQLPWLRRLDVCFSVAYVTWHEWGDAMKLLSKLGRLESLGLCVLDGETFQGLDQIVTALPEVLKARDRGVKLNIMADYADFHGVFQDLRCLKTAWITHA